MISWSGPGWIPSSGETSACPTGSTLIPGEGLGCCFPSALRITNIDPVPTGTRVTWSSVPGKRYALQISTDLSNWTRVLDGRGQPIVVEAAAGTTTSFRVPSPGGRAFLRIVVTR